MWLRHLALPSLPPPLQELLGMNSKGSSLWGPVIGGILLEETEPQCSFGASHSSLCYESGAGTGHPKGPDTFILN